MSHSTIFLIRHGETEWNRSRRYQGWRDSPLTGRGVAQAEAIGRGLCALPEIGTAEIVASPIGRARRTAEIIAECLGRHTSLHFDERLKEISLGSWDGLHRNEIAALSPGIFDRDYFEWYFRTPDGETYDKFAGRVASWLAEAGNAPLIVVTHGIVTRVLRGLYAGLPRHVALSLPVPQDRIFRLAAGTIEEILV